MNKFEKPVLEKKRDFESTDFIIEKGKERAEIVKELVKKQADAIKQLADNNFPIKFESEREKGDPHEILANRLQAIQQLLIEKGFNDDASGFNSALEQLQNKNKKIVLFKKEENTGWTPFFEARKLIIEKLGVVESHLE